MPRTTDERTYRLVAVDDAARMPYVRRLFLEYARGLGIDLCFQGFQKELESLPGAYGPPKGRILLAVVAAYESPPTAAGADSDSVDSPRAGTPAPGDSMTGDAALEDDQVAGCAALRPIGHDVCEMKRLFVRPEHRGAGLGRRLAKAVIDAARMVGYRTMRLDTLNTMAPAIALYRSLGFVEIPPYYHNPIPTAAYFELAL